MSNGPHDPPRPARALGPAGALGPVRSPVRTARPQLFRARPSVAREAHPRRRRIPRFVRTQVVCLPWQARTRYSGIPSSPICRGGPPCGRESDFRHARRPRHRPGVRRSREPAGDAAAPGASRRLRRPYHQSPQRAMGAGTPRQGTPGHAPPARSARQGSRRRQDQPKVIGIASGLVNGRAFVTMACVRCTKGFTNCCGEICGTVAPVRRAVPRRRYAR
jgi:hypothetical protein